MTWLVHFPINAKAFSVWAAGRQLAVRGVFDIDHAAHVLITGLFGRSAFQPFRLHSPNKGPWSLIGNSKQSPDDLRKMAFLVGQPEMLNIIEFDKMASRELADDLDGLKRIGFEIRFSPTRRYCGEKNREVDAWISEAEYRYQGQEDMLIESGVSREDVYRKWLAERLNGIAELESFRMVRYQQLLMVRSGSVRKAPDVVAQGTIYVEDASALVKILHEGLGRNKAYGFGMFALRPADNPA